MARIVSIQVGTARTYSNDVAADGKSRAWTTAFFKSPIPGPAHAGEMGLSGDQQADRENHGGLDKAVLAYSADHYAYWRAHLNLPDMPYGGFGENFTIEGVDETGVCIGDQWGGGRRGVLGVPAPPAGWG